MITVRTDNWTDGKINTVITAYYDLILPLERHISFQGISSDLVPPE